ETYGRPPRRKETNWRVEKLGSIREPSPAIHIRASLHALSAPAVRGRSARDVFGARRKRVVAGRGGPR
ncbi:hypothetical protein V502_09853, partial [Pseudogymnoascus sp. VKM F-4520 (FW-2644)]